MKIIELEATISTSEYAKELAAGGAEAWTIVTAKEQTGGHGRKGEDWFSPAGGLYFSVILPQSDIFDLQTLTILAAFIVAKVIKENFGLEPMIKLPNDVYVNGKKICGILTENTVYGDKVRSVIGIGLNTNTDGFPEELKGIATSLRMETLKQVDDRNVLEQIISGLKYQLETINQ
jgi:BirA family biotin operon repressor/biotin-[acetyl-CoA-carboxylase] ligase